MLDDVGFNGMDEFDLVLWDGIGRGFFDERALAIQATVLDERAKIAESEDSFGAAWRLYHDSFDDNEPEVTQKLFESFCKNAPYITPVNVNGTITLLKELGHPDKASAALQHYMEVRSDERKFFDLSEYAFERDVTDPDVRAAFDAKYVSFKDPRPPVEVLVQMGKNQSFPREDVAVVAKLTTDELYAIFRKLKGTELRWALRASVEIEHPDADPELKELVGRAREALKKIASESTINRLRAKKYITS